MELTLFPDGGSEQTRLTSGDIVVDRIDSNPSKGVVVNMPPMVAEDWDVDGRGTVAEDNPNFPADDPVVVISYLPDLCSHYPRYSGVKPLPIAELNEHRVRTYTFPKSRLKRLGSFGPHELPLDQIENSPYHARTFCREEAAELIEKARETGEVLRTPLVREYEPGKYRLVNGHKRIWAAREAGLETAYVNVCYIPAEIEAQKFIDFHLREGGSYTQEEIREAARRLSEEFGGELSQFNASSRLLSAIKR